MFEHRLRGKDENLNRYDPSPPPLFPAVIPRRSLPTLTLTVVPPKDYTEIKREGIFFLEYYTPMGGPNLNV